MIKGNDCKGFYHKAFEGYLIYIIKTLWSVLKFENVDITLGCVKQ